MASFPDPPAAECPRSDSQSSVGCQPCPLPVDHQRSLWCWPQAVDRGKLPRSCTCHARRTAPQRACPGKMLRSLGLRIQVCTHTWHPQQDCPAAQRNHLVRCTQLLSCWSGKSIRKRGLRNCCRSCIQSFLILNLGHSSRERCRLYSRLGRQGTATHMTLLANPCCTHTWLVARQVQVSRRACICPCLHTHRQVHRTQGSGTRTQHLDTPHHTGTLAGCSRVCILLDHRTRCQSQGSQGMRVRM